jgi:class 3 adenylate cyclase/tetratricopeptide (TPR) repeat protein
VICPSCGTANEAGRKFCGECGTALSRVCPSCGAANAPAVKFCGECGAPLSAAARAPDSAPQVAERKLVTILFADLVGFTSLAEGRDAEEVRDLLTRYFDTARRLVGLYGGTLEKFIGDAVMAVWGAPVAQEDDAERAVRAALDLVAAVAALGQEVGAPELAARAGVLTGEAAVTVGAEGQGLVAGDLVNTASRVQAAAEPGTVLVGEATRRAAEAAVVFADAGAHELKGKAEPVPLWRAVRVVALVGGALKSSGLEAPFVGRDRDFRLVKELFHAGADEGKAHLVSVGGIAGIGKSRLAWEFFKYIDGLADTVYWHRGRCLSYGDGVTYWALAEMVRMRAEIAEGEEPRSAAAKLRAALDQHVPDPDERQWLEPRLAHLLGLEDRTAREPEDLYGAWRRFLERLAEQFPTVLVFEDLQWADAALLDFIDYLMEWSRSHPLFVVTLARPELHDRRPGWGAGRRNFTSLGLEPLSAGAMEALLDGLAPGLPEDLRARILERAEGVPLYAVETVRMLIDRGVLVPAGDRYRVAGPIESLEVPESLHALIAARLDGLPQKERRLLQQGAVLGKSFTSGALAAVSGSPRAEVEAALASLVRKEVLGLQDDPRSPERGQFGFLQDLVKRVAYDTLSKRDRKALHLATARHLEGSWPGDQDEIVEIVASHYLEAYGAAPSAEDAPELKARACQALARAGERAASLAAHADAQGYFDRAYELAVEPEARARLATRAGEAAEAAARREDARERFQRAIDLFRSVGGEHAAARASAKLAGVLWAQFLRIDEAVRLMDASLAVLSEDEADEDVAFLMAQAARLHYFAGDLDLAAAWVDRALAAAEARRYPEVLSQALNTKSLILRAAGRYQEAVGLLKHALDIALENDLGAAALRALFNLADEAANSDRHTQALELDVKYLARARRAGDRVSEMMGAIHLSWDYQALGRWDEAVAIIEECMPRGGDSPDNPIVAWMQSTLVSILMARGQLDRASEIVERIEAVAEGSTEKQDQFFLHYFRAVELQARGRSREALEDAEAALATRESLTLRSVAWALVPAVEAAFDLGRPDKVEELLSIVESAPPAEPPPSTRAHVARFRARLAALAGDDREAEAGHAEAVRLFGEASIVFWQSVAKLEYAEWLVSRNRDEEARPLLSEARETFERLRAIPWLERADRLRTVERAPAAVEG